MRSSGKGVLGRGTESVGSFERREILTLNRKRISRFEASMPTAWKEGTRPQTLLGKELGVCFTCDMKHHQGGKTS